MRTTHHATRQAGRAIGLTGAMYLLAAIVLATITAGSGSALLVLAEAGLSASISGLATVVAFGLVVFAVADACLERTMLRTGLWIDHVLEPRLLKAGLAASDPSELLDTNRALGELRDILIGGDFRVLLNIPLKLSILVGLAIVVPPIGVWALVGYTAALLVAGLGAMVLVSRNRDRQSKSRLVRRGVVAAAAEGHALVGLGLAHYACRAGAAHNRKWIASAFRFGRTASNIAVLHRGVLGAALFVAVGLVMMHAAAGELSVASVLALSSVLGLILSPLTNTSDALYRAMIARDAWIRLSRVSFSEAADRLFSAPDLAHRSATLSLRDVDFAYPGGPHILKRTSLVLCAGEAISLHGAPGAGKSTAAALLAGGRIPTGGLALIGDAPSASHQSTTSQPRISWLTDEPLLLEGSVAENISRFSEGSHEAAMAAVRRAGVGGIIATLDRGLDTWVSTGGRSLSMRQRRAVALARTLYGNPAFLVLDEPESGLDDASVDALAETLDGLKGAGTGLCIVSKHPRLLALADKSYLIANGTLVPIRELHSRLPELAAPEIAQTHWHAG